MYSNTTTLIITAPGEWGSGLSI